MTHLFLRICIFLTCLGCTACLTETTTRDPNQDTLNSSGQPNTNSPPENSDLTGEALTYFNAVNQARAISRTCGSSNYKATKALQWSPELYQVAYKHALDMATNDYFSHQGQDGSNFGERADRENYQGFAQGENIAWGANTVESVMQMWLNSPGHCANIMNSSHTEFGMALVATAGSRTYGCQVFGAR